MPAPLEFASDLLKVVYLAVEHNPDGLLTVRHWLMTADKIDDREAAKTQTNWAIDVATFIVRTTMNHGLRHRRDIATRDGLQIPEIELSANAAHAYQIEYGRQTLECAVTGPAVHRSIR